MAALGKTELSLILIPGYLHEVLQRFCLFVRIGCSSDMATRIDDVREGQRLLPSGFVSARPHEESRRTS